MTLISLAYLQIFRQFIRLSPPGGSTSPCCTYLHPLDFRRGSDSRVGYSGNDHYLFHSAIFWLSMPLAFCVALAPRYIAKAWSFGFQPTDIDIMRWIRKTDPDRDITHDALLGGRLGNNPFGRVQSRTGTPGTNTPDNGRRSAMQSRQSLVDGRGSRTDMSTGVRSIHRGFDFATEENGVAMRRMQSNLSERRLSAVTESTTERKRKKTGPTHLFSLRRTMRRKKPPTP